MTQWIEANWLLVVIALAIAALILLWIIAANRRTRVELTRDESVADAPARRNQALIDAAPAAAAPSPIPPPVAPAPFAPPPPAPAPIPAEEPVAVAPDESAGVQEAILAGATVAPAPPMVADVPPSDADTGSELLRIKGLGPKLVDQLQLLGVTRLEQIAQWDDAEIDRIDAQLGRFQGRIRRDDWPTQARLLAADDITGYEERFGRV